MDERSFVTAGSTERPRAERPADLERLWSPVTEFCHGGYEVLIDPKFDQSFFDKFLPARMFTFKEAESGLCK